MKPRKINVNNTVESVFDRVLLILGKVCLVGTVVTFLSAILYAVLENIARTIVFILISGLCYFAYSLERKTSNRD